eukprot:CAMPEP_0181241160 /NCGR_PEP_ID=MMETSP1096-20121128/40956_1 /TAXON_ID=156174 ORGANISM="Chrysochromulina ericina, Strain CCMP281" /NCGR_SAMPLE_ID=MMETSP1096 /ASSEMBLY_ACC=CAM_ASM_000453 /LENGTH=106 /DNA_ID=CAMNT_0023337179 /DNA_START=106 /DNA_END=423 /DNA_ORIENTATION=+
MQVCKPRGVQRRAWGRPVARIDRGELPEQMDAARTKLLDCAEPYATKMPARVRTRQRTHVRAKSARGPLRMLEDGLVGSRVPTRTCVDHCACETPLTRTAALSLAP